MAIQRHSRSIWWSLVLVASLGATAAWPIGVSPSKIDEAIPTSALDKDSPRETLADFIKRHPGIRYRYGKGVPGAIWMDVDKDSVVGYGSYISLNLNGEELLRFECDCSGDLANDLQLIDRRSSHGERLFPFVPVFLHPGFHTKEGLRTGDNGKRLFEIYGASRDFALQIRKSVDFPGKHALVVCMSPKTQAASRPGDGLMTVYLIGAVDRNITRTSSNPEIRDAISNLRVAAIETGVGCER